MKASIADFPAKVQRQIAEKIAAENQARIETAALQTVTAKRGKYGNKKVAIDQYVFDSQKEGRRYIELKALLHSGQISNLEVHPRFKLEVYGFPIAVYEADFAYDDLDGTHTVEDAKGYRTREYKLKKKLMRACLGIEIQEV